MSFVNKKKFAIYCSGGASRVIGFYSNSKNFDKLPPTVIMYDGGNLQTEIKLKKIFDNRLKVFSKNNYLEIERREIHETTSRWIHKCLINSNSEYLFCFGNKIFKNELIDHFKNRLINFHPSLLPSFKGLNAIDQAIEANAKILGNTAHFINEKVDDGKIIIQSAILRENYQGYESVLDIQYPMLKIILRDMLSYDINDDEIFSEVRNFKGEILIPSRV